MWREVSRSEHAWAGGVIPTIGILCPFPASHLTGDQNLASFPRREGALLASEAAPNAEALAIEGIVACESAKELVRVARSGDRLSS